MIVIFTSFWDRELFAGYSLSSFAWWTDLIVIGIILLCLGVPYFLLVWLFGRLKMDETQKKMFLDYKRSYKKLSKDERKEEFNRLNSPTKRVFRWTKLRPILIPVVSFVCVLSLVATPVLTVAGEQLMVTLFGSPVIIYDTPTSIAAAAEAKENVVKIEEEGIVLMKNDNDTLPIQTSEENKTKVNIFGSCAFGMMFGNGGSGTFATNWTNNIVSRYALRFNEAMEEENFEYNQRLYNVVANNFKSKGKYTAVDTDYLINCGVNTYNYAEIVKTCIPYEYEVPASVYERDDLAGLDGQSLLDEAKEYSDIAIYAITRYGTESQDMKTSEMQLKTEEINMLNMLKANFDKVIVLLNVPQSIEIGDLDDPLIDSVLFVGHPGLTGTKAIAEVLNGKVNPSGHLVDTWAYDAKSAPSYQSFGNDTTKNYGSDRYFVEFVEGIYVGYRYYVTRAMTDPSFIYENEVQYSFGHGLSYTTFDQHIESYKVDKEKQTVTIGVQVKNTGSVAGKDVVQVYTHAPYYDGGIEKSYYSLTSFLKTNLLEPNAVENYEFVISFREMASWTNEKEMYILEKGDYEIMIKKNVWDDCVTTSGKGTKLSFSLTDDVEFPNSYQTNNKYERLFEDVEHGPREEALTYTSRSNWSATMKKSSEISTQFDADKLSGGKALGDWKFEDNQVEGEDPLLDKDNGLTLRDLKDADWDDERWELLLQQMSLKDMENLIDNGGFKTSAIASIGKEESKDYDGPASAFHSGTGHPSEVVLASTWNVNMAEIMGQSIGKEGAARGITGWYAPGINIHRSPYGGRNFEYYSEDPLISGLMAGNTSKGLSQFGVYAYAKHFALNEQEYKREQLYTWASEQAIREIYARGFEIYSDLGGLGIMTSFNKVGSYWAGANKSLLTDMLREEWGFHGVVVTDYCYNSTMGVNVGIRAQNDLWLLKNGTYSADQAYKQTPNDCTKLFKRACKNILYACAHSNNVWTIEDYQAVGIEEVIKATDRS